MTIEQSLDHLRAAIRAAEAKIPASLHTKTGPNRDPSFTFSRSMLENRLADAHAKLSATACANDKPPRSVADMEAQWEACKGKAKADGVKTPAIHCAAQIAGVTNSATPPPLPSAAKPSLEDRIAKLEKDLAAAKAAPTPAAGARIVETAARAAATALSQERRGVPAGGWGKQEPLPQCPANLSGKDRREFFRALSVLSPENAKYADDNTITRTAVSNFSSEDEKAFCMKEANRRGWFHNGGIWSKSH
jgi:hypothetical protein